jgi:hypothetical protein
MANRADIYVKNGLTDNINVVRKLPDGSVDLDTTVAAGSEEMLHLPDTDVSLLISSPEGMDTKECPVKVKSGVDLAVTHSRTGSNWVINIVPNDLPSDVPTTVNVDVGESGP